MTYKINLNYKTTITIMMITIIKKKKKTRKIKNILIYKNKQQIIKCIKKLKYNIN